MLQSNENRILCDFVAECTPAMDSDRDQSVNNYYDIIYLHTKYSTIKKCNSYLGGAFSIVAEFLKLTLVFRTKKSIK